LPCSPSAVCRGRLFLLRCTFTRTAPTITMSFLLLHPSRPAGHERCGIAPCPLPFFFFAPPFLSFFPDTPYSVLRDASPLNDPGFCWFSSIGFPLCSCKSNLSTHQRYLCILSRRFRDRSEYLLVAASLSVNRLNFSGEGRSHSSCSSSSPKVNGNLRCNIRQCPLMSLPPWRTPSYPRRTPPPPPPPGGLTLSSAGDRLFSRSD